MKFVLRPRRIAVYAALALVLTGCISAPETGRRQLILVSPQEEVKLGLQSFQRIKSARPTANSPRARRQLEQVGRQISRVIDLPDARWEFVLFDSKEPNAFALPGGKIGVNMGILPITKNEAGLATVLAHEIAHVYARHGAERMSQGLLVQAGGTVLSVALGSQAPGARNAALQAYGLGTKLGVMLPYSRTQELEADRIGLLVMARAGYDPREALMFWERFQQYSARRGGAGPEFMSTHPLDAHRIASLQQHLPRALAEYRAAGGS